jgi:mannonate dehydratase
MHVGTQHDPRSDDQYRALVQLGLEHVCADPGGPSAEWTTERLIQHREKIESFGLALDMIPLCHIGIAPRDEYPNIMLGKSPERDREIERICEVIRSTAAAGIPAMKYYMSYLGVFRTEDRKGRGGSSNSSFVFAEADQNAPLTEAGVVDADTTWERISYFLERVIPVAEEYRVRLGCHPHDPGVASPQGYRGIDRVMGSVEGIKRFVEIAPSDYHGLNFCQGTVSEMLEKPGEEIYDVIRYFGSRDKIFNVHFRNIKGGFLDFVETFPDEGDVDMYEAARVYKEVGYKYMLMPDHVPHISGPAPQDVAMGYSFGYIQALIQAVNHLP